MGLIGENGAGKTTIIKLIMQLLIPDKGSIHIFGLENNRVNNEKIKQNIGFVYDKECFYEKFCLQDMKEVYSNFYTNWDNTQYKELINLLEIDQSIPLKNLSLGKKKICQIILALCHHAKLLILDEPSASLDPASRVEFLRILRSRVAEDNASVLFSSHITSDLEDISDYVCFVHKGKLIFYKDIEKIREEYNIIKANPIDLAEYGDLQFICSENNNMGFKALYAGDTTIFKDNIVVERAKIQEIMYYYKESLKEVKK